MKNKDSTITNYPAVTYIFQDKLLYKPFHSWADSIMANALSCHLSHRRSNRRPSNVTLNSVEVFNDNSQIN